MDIPEMKYQHNYMQSAMKCPICDNLLVEDNLPPNYGGGTNTGFHSKSSGMIKAICLTCKTQIKGYWTEVDGIYTNHLGKPKPLTEQDGKYLTDWDVSWEEMPPGSIIAWA